MNSATTFHRRPLPAKLIAFSSHEGRQLFREALADGTMEGYFPLAEQFHTQSEPSFCGLGTLVMVLNALAIDPKRSWKGVWRWYGEELLDCCRPLDVVKKEGITLSQFVCLARCNGAEVRSFRADTSSLDAFRELVSNVCTSTDGRHLVAAYSRKVLGQTGDGHYSPIGGFHREKDLVLVLDVARFKYPPHWVPLSLLWEAMQPFDSATGKPRGFVVLSRSVEMHALCCIDLSPTEFDPVFRRLREELPQALANAPVATAEDAVRVFLQQRPLELTRALHFYTEAANDDERQTTLALFQELTSQLHETEVYKLVQRSVSDSETPHAAELATMLFLATPSQVFAKLAPSVQAQLHALRNSDTLPERVRATSKHLALQLSALQEFCCS